MFRPKSHKLALLTNTKLKKGKPLRYNFYDNNKKTLSVLREKLTATLVLVLPLTNDQYSTDTDVCDT